MGEFVNLCSCRLVNLRREDDAIIVELHCPVQREEAPEAGAEAGETVEHRAKVPAVKILGQVAQPAPAQVLLER